MNERDAQQLAGRYVQAHGDQAVQASYDWVAYELVALLSDDAEATVATVNEERVVLALERQALVTVRVTEVSGEAADTVSLEARALRLGAETRVGLDERIEPVAPNGAVRKRRWVFCDAHQELAVATSERLFGGFASDRGPQEDELVARAVVARLGWTVPIPEGPASV